MYTGAPEKCLEVLQKRCQIPAPNNSSTPPAKKQTKERKNKEITEHTYHK